LRLKPTNPYDEHTVAIFNERGIQMGYASADGAPLIGKQMKSPSSRRYTKAAPTSGSGSAAGCLLCPTGSPLF